MMEGARNCARDCARDRARDCSEHSRRVSLVLPCHNQERWCGYFSTEETEARGISVTRPRSCIGLSIRALCTKPWSLPS